MEKQGENQICLREFTVYAVTTPKGWGPQEVKEYFIDEELAKAMVQMNLSVYEYEIIPVKLYVDNNGNLFDLQQKGKPFDETLRDQISKIKSVKEKLSEAEIDFINNYPRKL